MAATGRPWSGSGHLPVYGGSTRSRLTAAADPTPSARCSSRRAHRAEPGVVRHRGRAAPDGRPRGRRVGPDADRGASRDSASHGPPRAPRRSASPLVARQSSVAPDRRAFGGSGWRNQDDRSGRSGARSSSASRRRQRGPCSPDRHRGASVPLKRGARRESSPHLTEMLRIAHGATISIAFGQAPSQCSLGSRHHQPGPGWIFTTRDRPVERRGPTGSVRTGGGGAVTVSRSARPGRRGCPRGRGCSRAGTRPRTAPPRRRASRRALPSG